MDEFNKDLCNERHKNIDALITKMDKFIDTIFSRLNWFMVTAIVALLTALIDILLKK